MNEINFCYQLFNNFHHNYQKICVQPLLSSTNYLYNSADEGPMAACGGALSLHR